MTTDIRKMLLEPCATSIEDACRLADKVIDEVESKGGELVNLRFSHDLADALAKLDTVEITLSGMKYRGYPCSMDYLGVQGYNAWTKIPCTTED